MSTFTPFPKDKTLRVVQVGCGGMAQGWVERAIKKPGVEIVGLVDLRREAAEQTAAKFNLPPSVVYTSLDEALAKAKPDAVFDITVPSAHHGVTMAALNAGCHVLGEKPLSDSMEHAREVCAASEKSKRLYMVTQNRRYLNTIQPTRNGVKNGTIGALSSLDADFYLGAHFGGFRDVMDHVLILDMAIHHFDQARFLSGCDPLAVYCHEYNPHGSWFKHGAAAVCIFEMTGGVTFTYRGSWTAEGFSTSWQADWRIVGTNGSIRWDGESAPQAQVVKGNEGFRREMADIALPDVPLAFSAHDGVLEEFLTSLRNGTIPQTECHDNIKSLAMCFAAIESASTRQRVEIRI